MAKNIRNAVNKQRKIEMLYYRLYIDGKEKMTG